MPAGPPNPLQHAGRAWVFGDDLATDALAPGRYMKFGIEEIAKHCLESIDPRFAAEVRAGDIVVGERNFGAGSSREQARRARSSIALPARRREGWDPGHSTPAPGNRVQIELSEAA